MIVMTAVCNQTQLCEFTFCFVPIVRTQGAPITLLEYTVVEVDFAISSHVWLCVALHSLLRYDWSPGIVAADMIEESLSHDIEYVPMIWGEGDLADDRLDHLSLVKDESPYLLGFNEPNFVHQVREHVVYMRLRGSGVSVKKAYVTVVTTYDHS